MSDTGKHTSPVSKLIRERAMAILRDTRSKIDPKLLEAMKDHISAVMPAAAFPGGRVDADMPLSQQSKPKPQTDAPTIYPKAAAPTAAAAYRQTSHVAPPPPKTKQAVQEPVTKVVSVEKSLPKEPPYTAQKIHATQSQGDMEPVDRQKIAQIVVEYMKNREDGKKH